MGIATGHTQIGEMFADLGERLISITHDYAHFNWVFSGTDVVVCEGTSHGEHVDGSWCAGNPDWAAGYWCDVFRRSVTGKSIAVYLSRSGLWRAGFLTLSMVGKTCLRRVLDESHAGDATRTDD